MELDSAVVTPSPSPTTTASTPDTDTDTPPTTHLSKALLSLPTTSFRRYRHPSPPLVVYRECLKNHAATLGGHALDGCGEFMPAPTATPTDPTSLKCAACGCHRNFHRRDPEPPLPHPHTHLLEYHPNPISPPPISSSYYPSALLALSTGLGFPGKPENTQQNTTTTTPNSNSNSNSNSNGGRKRHRTKFSEEQKEKMYSFSEKLGWKMQKRDQGLVEHFCTQVGVPKGVLKVWMHNNKHTFGKRDPPTHLTAIGIGMDNLSVHPNNNNNSIYQVAANSAST